MTQDRWKPGWIWLNLSKSPCIHKYEAYFIFRGFYISIMWTRTISFIFTRLWTRMSCVKCWRITTKSSTPLTIESSKPGTMTLTTKEESSKVCSNGIWSTEAVVATVFDRWALYFRWILAYFFPNWRFQVFNGQKTVKKFFFSNSENRFLLIGACLVYVWNIVAKLAKLEKKFFFREHPTIRGDARKNRLSQFREFSYDISHVG